MNLRAIHFVSLILGLLSVQELFSEVAVPVKFSAPDGARIQGLLVGKGTVGLVLVAPALNGKEFWESMLPEFVGRGYMVLTYDPRGRGESRGGREPAGYEQDVLGAVKFLKSKRAKKVIPIGVGSGARTVLTAAGKDRSGNIKQAIVISPSPADNVEKIRATLLIMSSLRENFNKYAERIFRRRKEADQYDVYLGSAHGLAIFSERRRGRVFERIVNFIEKGPRKGMRRHN
ncbi:MAG: alpha/beta fold hydrolase [Planctomycetota bacterium]|nr:alpha/beta fold hydrolase [Planctomycetota bacterium]